MKSLNLFSLICYVLVVLLGLTFSIIYLFHDGFMSYHAEATGMKWEQLDAKMRVLITALMRVIAGGWLATTLSMSFFLIARIRFGKIMLSVALVITGLASLIPTLLVTLYVRNNSDGRPPWFAAAAGIVILLVALYFDHKSLKMKNN